MLRPRQPPFVKFVVALRSADADLARRARQLLGRRFGTFDLEQAWIREPGPAPTDEPAGAAILLSFERPLPPSRLVELAHESYAIEVEIAEACLLPDTAEPVLLQPAYVDEAKFVLGATRDGPCRVFLSNSIYAELALQYAGSAWLPLPWTAAEWLSDPTLSFLAEIRRRLIAQRDVGSPEMDTPLTSS